MSYHNDPCSSNKPRKWRRNITGVTRPSVSSYARETCGKRKKSGLGVVKPKSRSGAKPGQSKIGTRYYPVGWEAEDHLDEFHEIDVFILSMDTVLLRIRFPLHSMCIRISDFLCLRDGALLNDIIIDFYINHIAAHLLPDDSLLKLHLFPSLFWYYMKEVGGRIEDNSRTCQFSTPSAKLSQIDYWLEEEDVFDADFLVLPVNHKQHWSLVVVCSPMLWIKGKCELNTLDLSLSPVIIIFDSQQPVDVFLKSIIVAEIQSFLELAYTRRKGVDEEGRFQRDCFKCIVPMNLPQQKNNVDCGIYILEYARRFLLSPPELSSLQSGVFDFCESYPDFDVSSKRIEIQHTILSLCPDYDTWSNLLNTVDVPFEYNNHSFRIRERSK